jgi:hypothetical protein
MSIVDGTGLVEWEGMLFEPDSDLLARTRWVFAYIRDRGGKIKGNEAGRPYGVPSDQNVRRASETASGLSTVWYQWGRAERGETPSAADPRGGTLASDHTKGIATDTDCNDIALRREAMRLVGMVQTIASESWHFAIRGPALVDLTGWANLGTTPFDNTEKGPFMALNDDEQKRLLDQTADLHRFLLKDLGPYAGSVVDLVLSLWDRSNNQEQDRVEVRDNVRKAVYMLIDDQQSDAIAAAAIEQLADRATIDIGELSKAIVKEITALVDAPAVPVQSALEGTTPTSAAITA